MLHILSLIVAAQLAAWPINVSVEGGQSVAFSTADLAALPRVEVTAMEGGRSRIFSGVNVSALLERAGVKFGRSLRGPALAQYLVVEGHDGYRVVYSLTEFDADFADQPAILADRMDGQALVADEGPWRLILPREKRGARWVRQVVTLRVRVAK